MRHLPTLRAIEPREEVAFDYILNCHGGEVWECYGGSDRCRKMIVSSLFDLPLALQEAYHPLLEAWFVEEHHEKVDALLAVLAGLVFGGDSPEGG